MKRHLALAAAALLSASPAAAQGSWVFNASKSCATYLSNEAERDGGDVFIAGVWSGLNISAKTKVGSSTDLAGVLGEVKLVCRAEPSTSLLNATLKVYNRFKVERR